MGDSPVNSMATTVASGVVTGLATICVAPRFYIWMRTKAVVAWDDRWIITGLLSTLLSGALVLWGMPAFLSASILVADSFQGTRWI